MALLLTINENNYNRIMAECVEILNKGDILVYPTETSYAFGADALNPEAVERVHKAKQQNPDKAISVIVADLGQAGKIAEVDKCAETLAKRFMPGALTLVVDKKDCVPEVLSRRDIAFRIPGNRMAMELCKKFGGAVTATSANVSGEEPICSGSGAFEKFKGVVGAVLDAGRLPKREASTIFDCRSQKILRKGAISEKRIKKAFADAEGAGK